MTENDADPIPRITRDMAGAGSGDVVAENVAAVKALFPSIVTDGQLDFDVLRQLLGDAVEDGEERYGLNWKGKRRARAFALTPTLATLRPAKAESKDWDTTRNIVIEGDNLEVLKCLRRSYAGQVKLIYIDPPYNTGNDFVYPDNYADSLDNYERLTGQRDEDGAAMTTNKEASGRFHTDWLNMMYPRLMLAKALLRDDGILLYSIDDFELANSRTLLDDAFGRDNFIASITWDKSRKNDAKLLSAGHDYVLIYARSKSFLKSQSALWREAKPGTREIWTEYLRLRAIHGDDDGAIELALQNWFSQLAKSEPAKKWARYKRIDRFGPWRDRDISWPGGGGPRYDVIHPTTKQACKVPERGWIYSSIEEMNRQIALGTVAFRATHDDPPFRKFHLKPLSEEVAADHDDAEDDADDELATQVRSSYIYKQSQVSVKELRALMGSKVFTNPKDHNELQKLFSYVTMDDPTAKVLDFFAGSGTTGHAVMAQNAADGGTRQSILVQLPEPLDPTKKEQKTAAAFCDSLGVPRTIAELTKERLRRAGAKVAAENPALRQAQGDRKLDVGFRVYKLATSNLKPWQPDPDNLAQSLLDAVENILPDRSEDDLLVELLLKTGIDLTLPMQTHTVCQRPVHALGGGVLIVYLGDVSDADAEGLGQGIADWHAELDPIRATTFYFRDSGFATAAAKANVAAIIRQRVGNRVEKLASI
jgi:adenine-specific DNA-methyltransferase